MITFNCPVSIIHFNVFLPDNGLSILNLINPDGQIVYVLVWKLRASTAYLFCVRVGQLLIQVIKKRNSSPNFFWILQLLSVKMEISKITVLLSLLIVSSSGICNFGLFNFGCFNIGIGNKGFFNLGIFQAGKGNLGIGQAGKDNLGIFNLGLKQRGIFNVGLKPRFAIFRLGFNTPV